MGKRILIWLGTLVLQVAIVPVQALAGTISYLLRTPTPAQAEAVCHHYGLQLVRSLNNKDLYLVTASDVLQPDLLKQWVKNDPDVKNLEVDNKVVVPETKLSSSSPYVPPMPLTMYVTDARLVRLYGPRAWVGYVEQPAMYLTNAATVHQQNLTGAGVIVAIIDTGVDPMNRILAPVLVPGYDFTRNIAGWASELADLNQSTAAILEQSTSAILEQKTVMQLNQSTAAILEQSTAAILEGQHLPAYLGHGTMVAGLVHLVAPSAKIMPLKAFRADGSSNSSDVVRAIYFAVDNGAKVINMSFEIAQFSDELMRAINYASRKDVICIASVGNEGQRELVYPAALGNVVGVASTSQQNQPSSFTNLGSDLVAVAAPGEALVTTYLGSHYAAVWGTSFSSALVAGGAALVVDGANGNTSRQLEVADVQRAFSQANPACSPKGDLGAGCLDLHQAVEYIKKLNLPVTSH
jgi:subtilisin family serine protease